MKIMIRTMFNLAGFELATSDRSSCRKCKKPIYLDELRGLTEYQYGLAMSTGYLCMKCSHEILAELNRQYKRAKKKMPVKKIKMRRLANEV